MNEKETRRVGRLWNIIRGCVVGSHLETPDKQEALTLLNSIEPECGRCGDAMRPSEFTCPACGPTP